MTAQPSSAPLAEPTVAIKLPLGRRFTQADLDELPAGTGFRFELVDGTLIVSPAPNLGHQRIVGLLYRTLVAACPPALEVVLGPYDVKPTEQRTFEPDLLVARRAELEERALRRPPLLAVEVRSPSTRLRDEHLKRAAYEEAGIASYWLVDPDEPAMTVLGLRAGRYEQVASISGDEAYDATAPYPVRITLREAAH